MPVLIMLTGCCVKCHNVECTECPFPKRKGCFTVDDSKHMALIVFGLHFYDFSSDIYLATEIWRDNQIFDNLFILIAGIGSVVFILVPYVYNLFVAASIKKRLMFITENESTKAFFFHNSKIFTILVVLTGAAYHSLVLISSKI